MKMLTHLAMSNNKKNRTRSVLVTGAILLTTMLLMAIATFGYGTVKRSRESAGTLYGSYYGSYRNVAAQQVDVMKSRGEFTDIGEASGVGQVEHREKTLSLLWADEVTRRLTNLDLQMREGSFPQAADEIAAQPGFFESLGYEDAKVGDHIELNYRASLKETYGKGTFTISGILKEASAKDQSKGYTAYVSKAFFQERIPEEERSFTVYFRLNSSQDINYDNAQEKLEELAEVCGIEKRNVSKNSMYLLFSLDPGLETLSVCCGAAILVILFSIVVIYNIFQVGIAQKVQEYGKVKAMGATRKQMKKIVFREGMTLSAIGIPLGLLSGFLVGTGMIKWIAYQANAMYTELEQTSVSAFSLPVLLLVAALAFLTVWIALKKPMKIVAAISPVEAMRYQGDSGTAKGYRKGRQNMTVSGMTLASISGNRRRFAATILTMGLSCVLFVVMANVVGNMDVEYDARKQVPYGQFAVSLDYQTGDAAYPENNLDNILKKNPLDENMVEQIRSLKGVTQVKTRKILAGRADGRLEAVLVYDKEDFAWEKEQSGNVGALDYDRADAPNGLFYGWSYFMEENGVHIGDAVSMTLEDGENTVEYAGSVLGSFGSVEGTWVITQETYQKLGFEEDSNGTIYVDCRKEDLKLVEEELKDLLGGVEHVEMNAYEDVLSSSKTSIRVTEAGAYAFLAVVGIIGFMNMANTMIISIITRKRELGVLQAVGMTNRQLNRMLQSEGLFFTLGTVLVSLIVGLPAGYRVFQYTKNAGWIGIHTYHVPVAEILCMIAAITLLQLTLSFILSRNVKKESLVERIRHQE